MARSTKKLNMAAMKKAAADLNVDLPKGDPKVAAQALREHFTGNHESDALVACAVCGWEATEDFSSCPYCGTELGETTNAPEPAGDAPEPVDGEPVKRGRGRPKGSTNKGSQSPRKKGKSAEAQTKEIAKPDPAKIVELDERTEKIKGYRRSLAEEAYNIGVELKAIHEENLWKHKGFSSFSEYCAKELDYTRVMAYQYMGMASDLKKEDAVTLGVSKAAMISNAPPKRRKKLLEMAQEGKSRKDMQDWLRKVEGKTSAAPATDENRITVLTRANLGDTFQPWLGDKSGKPTGKDTKNKHIEFADFVTGYVLFVREDDGGKGLVFTLKKAEAEAAPEPAAEPAAESTDDAAA